MNFKFNEDQINIIEWCLYNQKKILTKNKLNREYYSSDIKTLKECKNIINKKRGNNENNFIW